MRDVPAHPAGHPSRCRSGGCQCQTRRRHVIRRRHGGPHDRRWAMSPIETKPDRRGFMKTAATGGAALVIGFYLPGFAAAGDEQQPGQEEKRVNPFNSWVVIDQSGQVTLRVGKLEMGQGVMSSLPTILADELECDW